MQDIKAKDITLVDIDLIIPNPKNANSYNLIKKTVDIKLTQGFYSTVDLEDYLTYELYSYKWHSQKYNNFNYAQAWCKKTKKRVKMHKLLVSGFECVDHKNGNTLDNTSINLRGCTLKQNARNAKKAKHGFSSKFKGVSRQSKNSYKARIRVNGDLINLGSGSDVYCAKLYNDAAVKYFGEFARINEL